MRTSFLGVVVAVAEVAVIVFVDERLSASRQGHEATNMDGESGDDASFGDLGLGRPAPTRRGTVLVER